jgi:ABC-type antimicrobial peptide transport system permease subunit
LVLAAFSKRMTGQIRLVFLTRKKVRYYFLFEAFVIALLGIPIFTAGTVCSILWIKEVSFQSWGDESILLLALPITLPTAWGGFAICRAAWRRMRQDADINLITKMDVR